MATCLSVMLRRSLAVRRASVGEEIGDGVEFNYLEGPATSQSKRSGRSAIPRQRQSASPAAGTCASAVLESTPFWRMEDRVNGRLSLVTAAFMLCVSATLVPVAEAQ